MIAQVFAVARAIQQVQHGPQFDSNSPGWWRSWYVVVEIEPPNQGPEKPSRAQLDTQCPHALRTINVPSAANQGDVAGADERQYRASLVASYQRQPRALFGGSATNSEITAPRSAAPRKSARFGQVKRDRA